jgi:Glycosyl transferases group 1
LPNVILESLACGTPVAAFQAGGVPDMLEDGVNGFMAPVGDIEQLERILRKLIDKRDLLASMAASCAQSVRRKFSPSVIQPQLVQCYDAISRQPAKGSPLDIPASQQKYSEIPSEVAWGTCELAGKRLRDLQQELHEARWAQPEKKQRLGTVSSEQEKNDCDTSGRARTASAPESVIAWLRYRFRKIVDAIKSLN